MSSVAIFLLAFVLFVTVFGGLCLWAVVKINEQRREGAGASSAAVASADPAASFTQEDAHNLFLITTDTDAQGFIVVRADPGQHPHPHPGHPPGNHRGCGNPSDPHV